MIHDASTGALGVARTCIELCIAGRVRHGAKVDDSNGIQMESNPRLHSGLLPAVGEMNAEDDDAKKQRRPRKKRPEYDASLTAEERLDAFLNDSGLSTRSAFLTNEERRRWEAAKSTPEPPAVVNVDTEASEGPIPFFDRELLVAKDLSGSSLFSVSLFFWFLLQFILVDVALLTRALWQIRCRQPPR